MKIRTFFALLIAFALCAPAPGAAQDAVSVTILPFSVYARGHMDYLGEQIPEEISAHLKKEGIMVRGPSEILTPDQDPAAMDIAALRAIGKESWADYVVWGSFSKIGRRYSIDAKVLPVYTQKQETTLFVEGDGMETLMGRVSELSQEISTGVLGKKKITSLRVTGNKRIESDAILRAIASQKGDVFSPGGFTSDVRAIFEMGYFDDVRVEAEDTPEGRVITFIVKEKPTVHTVSVKGARALTREEVLEVVDITRGSIVNPFRIEENVKRIKGLFLEKNYNNVKVTYEIIPYGENEADIKFKIDEGDKVRIKEITFEGNKAFTARKLKSIIKTKEKGIFSFLTSSGNLIPEDLEYDMGRIGAFYANDGYMDVKVSDPEIRFEGKWIYVTVKIEEGSQFKVGEVQVEGDLIIPKENLERVLQLPKKEVFSQEAVRSDILVLTDIYSNAGYAYVDVHTRKSTDLENLTVNITYDISQGPLVYFEEILITGNTVTRDKVIRRELPVYEQGKYSGGGLKRGVQNLTRLDFFEDIKVDTVKGSKKDTMVLKIGVAEKRTGSFTFGGGYSSEDDFYCMGSVAQRNFLGRGQTLNLNAQFGGSNSRFSLGFTEPWLFDTRLSMGVDIYDWRKDYDTYDKKSRGFRFRFGYPVWDYTRWFVSYGYDVANIADLTTDAPLSIQELEGNTVTSEVSTSIVYDSRNHYFNPSRGSNSRFSVAYSGGLLGGDVGYTKYTAESGWYFPVFWTTVWFMRGEGGYIRQNSGGILPAYDLFYLGGINSLRGFTWEDLSPEDETGALTGGHKFVQFNFEYHVPILEKAGILALAFFDTGDNYSQDESVDLGNLRKSWGFGVRWFSPMGPIRLERGYIIDPQPGESDNGRWEFTMGAAF